MVAHAQAHNTHAIDMTVPQTMAADVGPMLMGINGRLNETNWSSMLPTCTSLLILPSFLCMCVYMRVGERLGGAALTCERVHMHFLF